MTLLEKKKKKKKLKKLKKNVKLSLVNRIKKHKTDNFNNKLLQYL